jgi:putative spermidine/putrescine transport system permease protein
VVVYNNVIARFRRSSPALVEASMDLGANSFQTFRYVVLPNIATALLAEGCWLSRCHSTRSLSPPSPPASSRPLPIWMLAELLRPRQRPVTNAVAVFVIAVTFLPILAATISRETRMKWPAQANKGDTYGCQQRIKWEFSTPPC